jgi:outer membrane cobalamin receptor
MRAEIFIVGLFFYHGLCAQTIYLRGTVKEQGGENLPAAFLFLQPDSLTLTTSISSLFSIPTKPGFKTLRVSYVGYQTTTLSFFLKRDTSLTIPLTPIINQLHEVVVKGERYSQRDIVESTRSGTHLLSKDDIESIPVLGGEADVIKTLQLLPGTLRGVEGSSDYFVRGGAADQNLVLLDDVPIYNTSHLFGFVSVFNPDVIEKVESINGAFPADYGGRLSSVLSVQTASQLAERTHASVDVGLIASRIFVEQPLLKNKASIWIAGRRTYIDQVVRAIGEELPYFFYDLNGKLILQPTTDDRIELSYYAGEDILDIFRDGNGDGDGFLTTYKAGNDNQSLRWSRKWNPTWSSRLSLIRSQYNYRINNSFEDNSLLALSDIEDYGMRFVVTSDSINANSFFKAGMDWTRHAVSPNVINTSGFIAELLEGSETRGRVAHEVAVHAQYEWMLNPKWTINTGLRMSTAFTENKNYFFPEPRVSLRYAWKNEQTLKFSYSRMVQYLHRISNSAISSPTDIWYPVTEAIKPQTSHQVSAAWQRFSQQSNTLFSAEVYYKSMNNLIGYEEGTNLFFNNDFESKLIQGRGYATGFELLVKKEAGKLTGWISYTLSWSRRNFEELNKGEWFYSRYDRRHNGAVVAQYKFHKRWAISAVWEFISGARFTPVVGQYVVFAPTLTGVDLIPLYTGLNEVALANTHRLDMGIKFRSKPEKKIQWQWFAGAYNAYNRANPIGITIEQDENTGALSYSQPGLFGLIPFISYGISF